MLRQLGVKHDLRFLEFRIRALTWQERNHEGLHVVLLAVQQGLQLVKHG